MFVHRIWKTLQQLFVLFAYLHVSAETTAAQMCENIFIFSFSL